MTDSVKTVVAGTGHRPAKLGGYSEEAFERLVQLAVTFLKKTKPDHVISGMALGWDMALATAAVQVNIPFTAAVPFEGQQSVWPRESQERYQSLLAQADQVRIISTGGYSARKMMIRNQWMVDHADVVVSLYDGTPGGTQNCVNYANLKKKLIINLWEEFQKGNRHA